MSGVGVPAVAAAAFTPQLSELIAVRRSASAPTIEDVNEPRRAALVESLSTLVRQASAVAKATP
jgi:hypothetical protein